MEPYEEKKPNDFTFDDSFFEQNGQAANHVEHYFSDLDLSDTEFPAEPLLPPDEPIIPPAAAVPRRAQHTRHTKEKRPSRVRTVLLRIFATIFVTGCACGVFCLGLAMILCYGPSVEARNSFVSTFHETSHFKWIPNLFFSQEKVASILAMNTLIEPGQQTTKDVPFTEPDKPLDTIEVYNVQGLTYTGKMMVVYDPSRVTVGTLPSFGGKGWTIEQFVEKTGAVGAINAGGFVDWGGDTSGSRPIGVVIKDGKLVYGGQNSTVSVVGFDNTNHLVVGKMKVKEALERGVRDAVDFGPVLIVNGEPAEVLGSGGGLNPRTVIGQRADGVVLLLVIEGRQPHSLGASFADCIEQMLAFGAINAGNLDGGSSTMMMYQGKPLTAGASMYGSRTLPTVFLVI